MCPAPQDIKPCDNAPREDGKVRRLHCLRLISVLFPPLLALAVCPLLISCAHSLHKQLGCIDNCIQVVCVRAWMSGVPCEPARPPARISKIKLEAGFCFVFCRSFFLRSHTHLTYLQCNRRENWLSFHCCQEDNGGVWTSSSFFFFQSPQCFLSSIHCHCLLIGRLFGQPGVTGPKCDSTFQPLEPM